MRKLFSLSPIKMFACTLLSLCLVAPGLAQQTPAAPASQEEINKQLLRRLQELEDEVKQLKAQPATAAPAPAPAPAPPPPPAEEAPTVNEVAPRLKLNFFGDLGY